MPDIDLQNKPLIEAFVEVRWQLAQDDTERLVDPLYKFLLGRLYDRLLEQFPEHEKLPTATVPDEMVPHVVQHRFRPGPNEWPVVQVGPGIFSVNQTQAYTWSEFTNLAQWAVGKLHEAYPKPDELRIQRLLLRYIDAISLEPKKENIFEFLRNKLKIEIAFPDGLFQGTEIDRNPANFNLQTSFECANPKGRVVVHFSTAQLGQGEEKSPALSWQTTVMSAGNDVPPMPGEFEGWLESAHEITHNWFFKLIEGELLEEFRGE